jgi:ribonuclease T1
MVIVTLYRLPSRAIATLRLIAAGGPYPYSEDDSVFGNYGGVLPRAPRGSYHEFTVAPPSARRRGPRRIVTASNGADYYTSDHYADFAWIACGS